MDEVKPALTQRDRLGQKLLDLFEQKLKDGTLNATEQAVLARILIQSGWNIDPTRIPQGLKDKLLEGLDINDEATAEEFGIIPISRKA
jgi:hypothetical protein